MLAQWDPFSEFTRLNNELARLTGLSERRNGFAPPVDIREDQESITVAAELPGIDAKNVDVKVEDNILTLQGERTFEKTSDEGGYHRIERSYGSFRRSFGLPNNLDTTKVDANMKDGVLTIRIPKRAESQPRKIEVKGGK